MLVLVDLTRAHAGTEDAVLDRFMSNRQLESTDPAELYLLPEQARPYGLPNAVVSRVQLEAGDDDSAIAKTIYNRVIETVQGRR